MSLTANTFAALLGDDETNVSTPQETTSTPVQQDFDFETLSADFSEAKENLTRAIESNASKRQIKRLNKRFSSLVALMTEANQRQQQHVLNTVVSAEELIALAMPKKMKEQTCCACGKTEMSTYLGTKSWKCSDCFGQLQEYSCCRCGSSFKTSKAINPRFAKCRSCFIRKPASYADFM